MALIVYSQTRQKPVAAEEAAQAYFELLRLMQDRIRDLSDIEDFDAWLLKILLMGRYEDDLWSC
jgi:hypothetical protein